MDMPDLSNILGQEAINRVFEGGLSEPIHEVDKVTVDTKSLRLFLGPFQPIAAYQDRLIKRLDSIRNAVPEANQIECPSSLAGPVFEKLKYLEEENYLKDLYLNLLKRAIDKERVNEAHPAFVALIEQLSPDEALMLKLLADSRYRYELKTDTVMEVGTIPSEQIISNNFPVNDLIFPQNFSMYINHLKYLNFLDTPQYNFGTPDESTEGRPVIVHRFLQLSTFGDLFYSACIIAVS